MAKQKLELSFTQGFFLGALVCFLFCTAVVDKFFISKEVFELKRIYVEGRIYKLCEDR
jgi:formate/nitrite transporter FocA (FNT family)